MSKPNLLGFCSSIGIYRNKRLRNLRSILLKELPKKVPFAELSPLLFQVVMAFAGENQIDGDFSTYTAEDFSEIFAVNHVPVTIGEAEKIRKAFATVGLMADGKIRSWARFNRHFAEHEKIVKAKRKAAKFMHDKRDRDQRKAASEPAKNGEQTPKKPADKPNSSSGQLWLINQAIERARGPAKKVLEQQRDKLLSGETGVDLNAPAAKQVEQASAAFNTTPQNWGKAILQAAKVALEESPEILSEAMVEALVSAKVELPDDVSRRFRTTIERLNPVAG